MDSKVDAALASVDVAHAEQIARLESVSGAQIAQIKPHTVPGKALMPLGPPSVKKRFNWAPLATTWRGQKNGESTWLDGPVHDNQMEAPGAENVDQYDSLMASASERASAVKSGASRDLEAIQAMRQASSHVLHEQRAATLNGLRGNRNAGRARIEQTRVALHQAVDQRHATVGGDLDNVQAARHEQLAAYGGPNGTRSLSSIEAASGLSNEATEAGSAMMGTSRTTRCHPRAGTTGHS